MKAIKSLFGILFVIAGIASFLFLGIYMLCYGVWDIFHNFATLTFGQFVWDVILILGREILSVGVLIVFWMIGIFLIKK